MSNLMPRIGRDQPPTTSYYEQYSKLELENSRLKKEIETLREEINKIKKEKGI